VPGDVTFAGRTSSFEGERWDATLVLRSQRDCQATGSRGQRILWNPRESECRAPHASTLTAIKTATRHMAKEFYLKFSAARYWMNATQTGKHAQKEFETRSEVK
jgi:hypothetical protein